MTGQPPIWPSARALLAGFVVTVALSLGTDLALHATGVFPPWGQPMSDALFGMATVYRVLYGIAGSYTTARLAPHHPMAHVLVGGLIGTLLATAGAVATWDRGPAFGPKWYPVLLVVTAMPGAWAGGALERLQVRWTRTGSGAGDGPNRC